MIKNIITDKKRLSIPSEDFMFSESNIFDNKIIQDLLDTANANRDNCFGLAANQIGYLVRVFVMRTQRSFRPFINPEIICRMGGMKSGLETCLSRPGEEPIRVRRHKTVKVSFLDIDKPVELRIEKVIKIRNMDARIFQHEIDHFKGILI